MTEDEYIEALLSAPDAQARSALMGEQLEFLKLNTVYALKERANHVERDDPHQTLKIGLIAEELAERLSSDEALALALWAQANGHNHLLELEPAVRCYERAAEIFKALGKQLEVARIHIGQMLALIKMGEFEHAQLLAKKAREVFVAQNDGHYQAVTDMNLGVSYDFQGQSAQALEYYRQATEAFQVMGETLYAAMNQVNQANLLSQLDDFLKSESLYEQARPVFEGAGLRSMVAAVDHDLAILQNARGHYAKALQTFERARDLYANLSDTFNLAQTDLEESDIYLNLNILDEALHLAQRAENAFKEMGISFELARAYSNHAVALARLGQGQAAVTLLEEARNIFLAQSNQESNQLWLARTDLQRAEVLGQIGQSEAARAVVTNLIQTYKTLGMKTKQTYAHILSANLHADDAHWEEAQQELQVARDVLGDLVAPWLEQRIEACLGRVYEGLGQLTLAIDEYQKAANRTEQIASTLTTEEHRTSFVADKLAPYEALVVLYGSQDVAAAFQWAEQAKSRALVDLLAAGVRPHLHISDATDITRAERLQTVREELNWLYTRLTRGENPGESGVAAGADIWSKIEEREREATSLWRDLQGRHAEQLSLIRVAPLSPKEIQSSLPKDTALVEYFVARGQLVAFIITPEQIQISTSMSALSEILSLLENLAFQFSKFQYGPIYYQRHKATFLKNTQEILSQLGQHLFAPFIENLSGFDNLIIIPHGPLHALPFQAVRVNDQYLIEKYAISYAPSAAVLKFCWDKPSGRLRDALPFNGKALLVGVPDERAAHVSDEIQALAHLLGDADVLLSEQATFSQVRELAGNYDLLHIAAHGLFRPEAPLLSSIHLFDRWMTVQDIYDLDLHASLVMLSACETGLGHDAGGDDMVGLVRGFLYAGASSLIVSLWSVDDESMTKLTAAFYTHWLAGQSKAQALRSAQLALLKTYEHPFYWAPLVLVGSQN